MKKYVLPVFLSLLVLFGAAVFLLFAYSVLSGGQPRVHGIVKTEHPRVVELDTAWADALAGCATVDDMKAQLAQTLADAQAFGADTVMLTARTSDGAALFRDGTNTLSTAQSITQSDKFFARFDALRELVRQATAANLEVALLATDDAGTVLTDTAYSALPAWLTAQSERLHIGIFEQTANADPESPLTLYVDAANPKAGVIQRADDDPAALALLVQKGQCAQACLGGYTQLRQNPENLALFLAFSAGALPDLEAYKYGRTVAETLAVTYPVKDGSTVASPALFLMGTSDPAASLTLDGAEVVRYGSRGVWGVSVTLEKGANTFALENGGAALTYTVYYTKSTASAAVTPVSDGSVPAEAGQRIQVTDAIASALTSPGDASSISQTLYQGAVAEVVGSVQYRSGNKLTYAYQLASGDYVRSAACTLIRAENAQFTGAAVGTDTASRCTVLRFAGGGTPAVFHAWEDNTLTLTFYSAQYTGGEITDAEGFLQSAEVENGENRFTLTLHFAEGDPLYGWAVNYDAGTTSIWLKHTPQLSGQLSAPLAGVTVLLDPGHGGTDNGAMGSAGLSAPVEKDLNLSVAQAARYRLEQLGATVLMTRTDDAFPTLGDRVTALNTLHPDLFISVHHNSLDLTSDINKATGSEAYWFYDEGETLANTLLAQVCADTGRTNRGASYGYYYVTRSNICPATLLELGFVTNPAEYEQCESADTILAEGTAIAAAVYRVIAANG